MSYVLSDIATRVQTRVRDSGYSTTTIKGFINDTQNSIFNEYDLRFMETSTTYNLTTNVQDITNGSGLPSDFVSPINLVITTDNYENDLIYVDYKELDELFPDQSSTTATTPRYWWFYGDTISVYPKPDQAYVVRLRYLKKPTALSADGDVPDVPSEFEELLVYGAAYRVFEEKDMDEKAANFEAKYNREVQKLVNRYAFRRKGELPIMRLTRHPARSRATSIFNS